jgi:FemAB-related protein (PEP-CTERM system-associated)
MNRAPVTIEDCSDPGRWDSFIQERPDATGYHLWAWRGVFERAFGHPTTYLLASREGVTTGVLPLVSFRSMLFGRFLVSLPFVNYGGVLAIDDASANALVARASSIATLRHARYVELRHRERRFDALVPKQHKVTMLLPLRSSVAQMWDALDRKVRNQVRKAQKSGLVALSAGIERLDDFYRIYAHNLRDLGTPVYARRFFEEVLCAFPERSGLVIVTHQNRPIAASVTWRWRDTVEVPWAGSLRAYNAMSPNNLLYWTIILGAIAEHARVLDFGRSTPNEGTFHFKRQWGAEPLPLWWEYDLLRGSMPDNSPKNSRFRLAIETWKRLPLPLTNAVGPHLVRSIP